MSTRTRRTSAGAGRACTPSQLDALDAALLDVRTLVQRPRYRQRLLAAVGRHVDLGTIRVLRTVERAGAQPPSVGEIAEALAVDPSSASRMVDRCVVAGLLDRRASEDDRRRARLELTSAGGALLDAAAEARRGLLADVTAGWSADDLGQLVAMLHRLRAGFDQLEAAP